MRGRAEHPLLHVVVELVVGRGLGHGAPVRDVLAVAADGQARRVATARVGAVGRLHDGEDAVAGHAHPVPEALEVVDDTLDGRHDAPAGRPRAPDAVEERLGEDEVARRVGGGGMHQRDVGRQGLQESQRTERGVDDGEGLVVGHGRADQRPGHRRRQTPGGCLQALRQREDRPVLHLDLARFVGRAEDRVRRVGREAVARIGRDDLADEATAEEERAEAPRLVMTSVNPGSVPQKRRASSRAAAVQRLCPSITVDRVSRPDAARHGLFERGHDRAPCDGGGRRHKSRFPSGHRSRNPWSRRHFFPRPNLTTVSG